MKKKPLHGDFPNETFFLFLLNPFSDAYMQYIAWIKARDADEIKIFSIWGFLTYFISLLSLCNNSSSHNSFLFNFSFSFIQKYKKNVEEKNVEK